MSRPVDEPRYPYLVVEVAEPDAEEAGVRLFDLGATGVEQRDSTTLVRETGDRVILAAAFPLEDDARRAMAELPREWSPRLEYVVGDGWRDEWKKHFEPFRLCRGVVVRPPWRAYEALPGERVILLEPGRAFGTGLHETTRLVAEALADRSDAVRGSGVLDVGCGSGILSLAALALGAASVRALDVDPDAVTVTRENAERNGLSATVTADATPVGAVAEAFAVVVANIDAATLVDLAVALTGRLAPGGALVLSGILAPDVAGSRWEEVRRAYAALTLEEVTRKGEWLAAVLRA
jgi:ribosomal protein L11 methyltransferase